MPSLEGIMVMVLYFLLDHNSLKNKKKKKKTKVRCKVLIKQQQNNLRITDMAKLNIAATFFKQRLS